MMKLLAMKVGVSFSSLASWRGPRAATPPRWRARAKAETVAEMRILPVAGSCLGMNEGERAQSYRRKPCQDGIAAAAWFK